MGRKNEVSFAWVRLPHSSGVHLAAANAAKIRAPRKFGKHSVPYALILSRGKKMADAHVIGLFWARQVGMQIMVYRAWTDSPPELTGKKSAILDELLTVIYANFPEAIQVEINMENRESVCIDRADSEGDRAAMVKRAVMRMSRVAATRQQKAEAVRLPVDARQGCADLPTLPRAAGMRHIQYQGVALSA